MALVHLIYVSTARREYDAMELDEILRSCVVHNEPREITGMLLYMSGSFLQVIEGDEQAIDETFGRIERDPRHTDIYVIERAPVAERSFAAWNMGFRRLGKTDADAHPAFAPFFERGFDAASIGARPGLALDILRNFTATLRS